MMHRTWVIRRFGRRGVFLVMFGVMYLAVGGTTLWLENRRFTNIDPFIGPILDSRWWGAMWVAAGLAAIMVAVRRSADAPGFMALLIPPAFWTIFYGASVVAYLATDGEYGSLRSISASVAWSVAWSVILLVAGWPDPDCVERKA